MKKSRMSFTFHLDKRGSWIYQEILAEALLVVWICSKISVEVAVRVFPEWRTSRIDSQFWLVEWMDPGRILMGYDSDECFWYRAISCWISISTDPCANSSFPRHIPSATSTSLGYIGTVSTLSTTAVLYISLFCAIIANRHWRLPCFRLVTTMDDARAGSVNENRRGSIDNVPGESLESLAGSSDVGHETICAEIVRESLHSVLAAVKCIIYGVLNFIIRLLTNLLTIAAWLLCVISPIVLTMGLFARALILVGGDKVILPCYFSFASVLAVYCIGRIWGPWTIDLNRGGLDKIMSALIEKTTRLTGLTMSRRYDKTPTDRPENPASYNSPPRKAGRELLAIAEPWIGCWALGTALYPFVCRLDPDLAVFSKWVPVSSNCCFRAYTDKLDRPDALLSYWVDSAQLFGNTTNATNFNLPELSPSAQSAGAVWDAWSWILVLAWPVHCFYFIMLVVVSVGIIAMVISSNWSAPNDPNHDSATRESTRAKRASGTENERLAAIPAESTGSSERDDHRIIGCLAAVAVLLRYVAIWRVLPCAAAEFFLPEQYQWPGILFVATSCFVWFWWVAIVDVVNAWQCYKLLPDNSLEQSTEPAAPGSPGPTLIVNNSSSDDAVLVT